MALPLIIAGAAVAAIGAKKTADARAEAQREQARIDRELAASERQIAKADATDFRKRNRRLLATQRARLGGSGVTFEGSPLLVAVDLAREIEEEAAKIEEGGEIRASRLEQRAQQSEAVARASRTSGFLTGGQLLLEGAGTAFAV